MKKARQIEIPSDRPLTYEEFEDFKNHALNSSLWYASEYTRSEKQITEKLLNKGYIRDDVEYIDDYGESKFFNIIDHVIEHLKQGLVLDDEAYARSLINRYSAGRRGKSYIKTKLYEKGIDSSLAERLLEELRDEEQIIADIDSLAERYMNSSAYLRVEDKYKRRQKLTTHLVTRGYGFDDISLWQSTREE